jgi:hypothetical protein
MITGDQWNSLIHLKRADFHYPDKLEWSIVRALDIFISQVKSRPIILDDYRPGDPRQHGKGRAVDTTWPGADAVDINRRAIASRLFSGIGIYVNPAGAGSHHFDTRTDHTPAQPATWGGIIEHPFDEATNKNQKQIEYTTMQRVVDLLKKSAGPIANLALMVLFVYFLYRFLSPPRT